MQAEFEFDRIDYLDTIRKQDQTLKWYQSVVEQVIPTLRRDSNYADLEKVRAQSEWDDLNKKWKLPQFTYEKRRFNLPPAGLLGRSSVQVMSPSGSSSFSSDLHYELRSEERLIGKLNESAKHDPADYFRSGVRSGSSIVSDRRSATFGNRTVESTTPIPMSPPLRRPQHL